MGKYTKYFVLCGTVSINTVLCVTLYFGNISTYIYSYHYTRGHSDSVDSNPSWILPVYLVSKCFGTFIVDFIRKRIGLRLTSGLGISLYVASILLTYLAVTHSVLATTLTFTVMGLGNGMASLCNVVFVSGWFGSSVGRANALSISSGAVGGLIINMVVTTYVNPNNLSPDRNIGQISFFSQAQVVDRIPSAFLLIGGFTAGIQVFGFCFLRTPPVDINEEKACTLQGQKHEGKGENACVGMSANTCTSGSYTSEDGNNRNTNKQGERENNVCKRNTISGTTETSQHQNGENARPAISNPRQFLNHGESISMSPSSVLKSEKFYVLEYAVTAMALGILITTNYFKLFGQLWISDDHFLAFTGSCVSLGVIPFLIGGGAMIDRIGIKNTIVAHLAVSAFFMSFWYFTARAGKWLYLLWTVVVYCLHNNLFLVFSVSCLKLFGEPYFSTNFGLVQIPCLLVDFVGAPIATLILSSLGWFWLFFSCACVSFLALVPVIFRLRT